MLKKTRPNLVDDMVTAESEYRRLDEDSLTRLAVAVRNNEVFGSWMVRERDTDLLHHIFLVLSFMHDIERKKMRRDGIVHLYGFLHEKLPRHIEGYPCFIRAHLLDHADSVRLMRRLREIQQETDDE